MTTAVLSQPTTAPRPTLRDKLEAAGLPIVDEAQVRQHMTKTMELALPTLWHRLLNLLTVACSILSLFEFFREPLGRNVSTLVTFVLSVTLATTGILAGNLWGALLVIPFAALLVDKLAYLATFIVMNSGWHYIEPAFERWIRMRVVHFDAENKVNPIPAHIRDRIEKALTIPGARVRILAYATDPLTEVSLGRFRPERHVIGTWGTMSKMDNI